MIWESLSLVVGKDVCCVMTNAAKLTLQCKYRTRESPLVIISFDLPTRLIRINMLLPCALVAATSANIMETYPVSSTLTQG